MIIIKQYDNRNLYMVTKSKDLDKGSVNTQSLIDLIQKGNDIMVITNEGENVTHKVLANAIKQSCKSGANNALHNFIRNNIIVDKGE